MEQSYNWESNRIWFMDTEGHTFDLTLKGDKTIVNGASASGKTLLCSRLRDLAEDENSIKPYGADFIFLVNRDNLGKIYEQTRKLIIIDRAEMVLTDEIVQFINQDGENRYLLFMRKPMGIEITPNHFAELKYQNGTLKLEYLFDVGGWC